MDQPMLTRALWRGRIVLTGCLGVYSDEEAGVKGTPLSSEKSSVSFAANWS